MLLAKPEMDLRKKYPLQPIDCRIQKARFLSSKKGRSSPMPRAIGSAGDWILGGSDLGLCRAARRSRVALSVAIASRIEGPCGHCERWRDGEIVTSVNKQTFTADRIFTGLNSAS